MSCEIKDEKKKDKVLRVRV